MNNAWMNATSPNLTKGFYYSTPVVPKDPVTTGGLSEWTPYLGAGLVGLKYASNPLGALNQDLSKPGYGAMTGAGLGSTIGALAGTGSFAGPIGTAIGAGIGALAGFIGNKGFGLGKTKKVGNEVLGGTYNQNLPMMGVTQEQYNNYNQAMNYLNGYNAANNPDWAPIGASEYGRDVYKTKRIGHNKKSYAPTWAVGTNTGYNVMDDYIGNMGHMGWNDYTGLQGDIYNGRYDYLSNSAFKRPDVNMWDLAAKEDARQYGNAKGTLDTMLVRGYLGGDSYNRALNELQGNRATNTAGLADIGNNMLNQWEIDARQEMANKDRGNWLDNWSSWKKDEWNLPEMKEWNPDYSLMRSGSTYTPYQAMAKGIGNEKMNGYGNWWNNRRV